MSVTAEGPDGSTFEFPDGTPPEVVRRALGKHYGWPDAPPQSAQPQNAARGPWEDFAQKPQSGGPWEDFTAMKDLPPGFQILSSPDDLPPGSQIAQPEAPAPSRLADLGRLLINGATLGFADKARAMDAAISKGDLPAGADITDAAPYAGYAAREKAATDQATQRAGLAGDVAGPGNAIAPSGERFTFRAKILRFRRQLSWPAF